MKKKELYRNSIQISNLWEEKVRISIILVIVRIGRNIQPSLLHAVTFAYSPNTQNKEFCGFCFCFYYCLREYVNFQSLLKWSRCQNSPFFRDTEEGRDYGICVYKKTVTLFLEEGKMLLRPRQRANKKIQLTQTNFVSLSRAFTVLENHQKCLISIGIKYLCLTPIFKKWNKFIFWR